MKFKVKINFIRNQAILWILQSNQYKKKLKEYFTSSDKDEDILGFTYINQIFILNDNFTYGLLVHQIVHVVQNLMQHHVLQDEQARAYLTQYIYEQFIKKIQKKHLF